eukprot:1256548-Rhodomonas_salina.1
MAVVQTLAATLTVIQTRVVGTRAVSDEEREFPGAEALAQRLARPGINDEAKRIDLGRSGISLKKKNR